MVIDKRSKIFVAGHRGMVGSAVLRNLIRLGYNNILTKNRDELELMDQMEVSRFYKENQPEYVFICSAKVGGIYANNTYRAQFIYENLQIQNNLIHFAHISKVKKLLFMGSSCIYPKDSNQPMEENCLLNGSLEETNEPYAIAKIAGIKMCENYFRQYGSQFFSIMPTNAYGPNDNYDFLTSHVLAALIRKFYIAKCLEDNNIKAIHKNFQNYPISSDIKYSKSWSKRDIIDYLNNHGININSENKLCVTIWGSGTPQREFIHVDDIASAALFTMNLDFTDLYNQKKLTHLNVGTGREITIIDLAKMIIKNINYNGKINFDKTKPDGIQRKILSVKKINDLGWTSKIKLSDGIAEVIKQI